MTFDFNSEKDILSELDGSDENALSARERWI